MRHRYIIISAICWVSLLIASASWNIRQLQETRQELNLQVARSFFGLIVTMREWNAQSGGVYVPVSAHVQPNPYLEDADRDILLPDGRTLTKVNPAYMTRLVAELAQEEHEVRFHITSLDPVNPNNAPDDWEAEALAAFEAATQEYYQWDQQTATFSYMAPLIVEERCMACHEQHGYAVGDIRGGISITFSAAPVSLWPVGLSHSMLGLVGLAAIGAVGRQLARAFGELERQSQVDGLTGLYNRSYFDAYLRQEFARGRRQQTPLSVVIGDVDSFKAYNDLYGHQAGDSCLRVIAGALGGAVRRADDVVARYGGEEFVLILPNTTAAAAHAVAERARRAVEALAISHALGAAGRQVTLSLGVATGNGEDAQPEAVLARADQALYQAKQAGKNRVVSAAEGLAAAPPLEQAQSVGTAAVAPEQGMAHRLAGPRLPAEHTGRAGHGHRHRHGARRPT